MTRDTQEPTSEPTSADDSTGMAGSSTDQHVTGADETATFPTDEAPTADTPAHGSSNAGINAAGGNRPGRQSSD
jgi:hypothetical protein